MKATSNRTNMTRNQKLSKSRKTKEAQARRKVNEDWQKVESTVKYRRAAIKNVGWSTTDRIADEILDGIFLSLNNRNSDKSASEQRKLLRRIVEKRQAQAIHAKTRKGRDRKASVAVIINTSKCLERLHHLRFAC